MHRLDRNVSGVTLFARTSKAAARLGRAFQRREVRKIYRAIVAGRPRPPAGERVDFILKDEERRLARIYPASGPAPAAAREARLRYETLATMPAAPGEISLLEIELMTGRFHQIRAQCAAMGHPILGDKKYGAERGRKDWTLMLHASRLDLVHPVRGEELSLRAKAPWNMFSEFE